MSQPDLSSFHPSDGREIILYLDPEKSLPSATKWHIFHGPFLYVAHALLQKRCGPLTARLSPVAMTSLLQSLALRLEAVAVRTLDLEFSLAQAVSSFALKSGPEARAFFAEQWLREGTIFSSHPPLARLFEQMAEYWVDAVAEFLQRLDADWTKLQNTFFQNENPDHVESLTASLSDPHRGGRNVFALRFINGQQLIYKPRSTALEAAYFQLADWLNRQGSPMSMKIVAVLDRGEYGWMDFVEYRECSTEEDVTIYFERIGALLVLLYALAGTDIHYENFIAHGAHPVPVDLEILMTPERDLNTAADADYAAGRQMKDSVLSVGLLPNWVQVKKGQAVNMGGLDSEFDEHNSPRFQGAVISALNYTNDLLRGFEKMYTFLEGVRPSLLQAIEPFRGLPVRFVNRPTTLYARVLTRSCAPTALESDAARNKEFAVLKKCLLHTPVCIHDIVQAVCENEIAELERGDVPFFQGYTDSTDLPLPQQKKILTGFFTRTGFFLANERIKNLSTEDLAAQKKFILQAFDLMGGTTPGAAIRPSSPAKKRNWEEEALSLAKVLREDAIFRGDTVTWITPQLIHGTDAFRLAPANSSLYEGTTGTMLFLLAVGKYCGDKQSTELGRKTLHSLRAENQSDAKKIRLRQMPPGLTGVGGMVYALLVAAQLTGDDLVPDAAKIQQLLSEEEIRRDQYLDIMAGVAGSIPPLLALHAETGERLWLDRAMQCGDHLLAHREETPAGPRSWKCMGNFLSGYSHGAGGIAAALLRLHHICGEDRFADAAHEAVAYENSLFDADKQNWRDLRGNGHDFALSWCHGAPGIALARMQGACSWDDSTTRRDLAAALATTLLDYPESADHCCCGSAGRVDILLTAGHRDAAEDLLQKTAHRALARGGYLAYGQLPASVRGPGFFQGLGGIGYTMLRLKHPELPSVLGLELSSSPAALPSRYCEARR